MSDLNPTQFANLSIVQQVSEDLTMLKRILRSAPQSLWLDTIRRTEGDTHNPLIHWMLNQPECDFAIAVHAFYHSDPMHHLGHVSPLPTIPGPDKIFAQVLLNWDKGFYRRHALELQNGDADPRLIRRVKQRLLAWPRGALPFSVPAQFLAPQGGELVALPPHLSPDDASHLWPLYHRLDLRVNPVAPGIKRQMAKAKGIMRKVTFRSRRG